MTVKLILKTIMRTGAPKTQWQVFAWHPNLHEYLFVGDDDMINNFETCFQTVNIKCNSIVIFMHVYSGGAKGKVSHMWTKVFMIRNACL